MLSGKRDMFKFELFPDGNNEALKVIMNNAKSCGLKVFWNPVMRMGCQPPKGYDVIFLNGRRKNFIRYYANDLKHNRVSPIEFIKIVRSLF